MGPLQKLLGHLLILQFVNAQGGRGGGGIEDIPCNWPSGQQYWPHPSNCQKFIQCTPSGPQEMPCAPGTAWSQSLLTCDHVANTDCGQQPTTPPDNGVSRSCSEISGYNNTHFVEPTEPQNGACILTVNPINSNICQVRVDFINLELSEPDMDGQCSKDFFTVTGGTSTPPMICGSNSGQHMYVDIDPAGGVLKLIVDRSTASTDTTNNWDIKVTQISCNSRYRAPTGCLQYHTETSGTVSSFNFKQDAPTVTDGTREIANLDYSVCVQKADGYCGIIWERNTTGGNYGFTVSLEVNAIAPSLIGDPASSSTGARWCTTDYVLIPGGIDDNQEQHDRFCDAGFPYYVTSTSIPFVLHYHTDGNENGDADNRGFSLNYRQTTSC